MQTFSDPRIRAQRAAILTLEMAAAAWGSGTFGKVVPIGGHASDIALDETRGVLYIANYSANRVEMMNTSDRSNSAFAQHPVSGLALAVARPEISGCRELRQFHDERAAVEHPHHR